MHIYNGAEQSSSRMQLCGRHLGSADPKHQGPRWQIILLSTASVVGQLLLHVKENRQVKVVDTLPAELRTQEQVSLVGMVSARNSQHAWAIWL